MRLLIDTQILIWFLEGNRQLPEKLHNLIRDTSNDVIVSRVSLFEIAIKLKIGRLTLKRGLEGLIQDCQTEQISVLSINDQHVLTYNKIPFCADHRDPFDRLLLATALVEKMPILSADREFNRYRDLVEVVW